jgi:hypothetical protein
MTIPEFLEFIGLKGGVAVAGFAGGVVRALSRKRYTVREMVASPICGALAAAYLTLPILHYATVLGWPLPDDAETTVLAAAFVVGTSAMWMSDVLFEAVSRRFGAGPAAE